MVLPFRGLALATLCLLVVAAVNGDEDNDTSVISRLSRPTTKKSSSTEKLISVDKDDSASTELSVPELSGNDEENSTTTTTASPATTPSSTEASSVTTTPSPTSTPSPTTTPSTTTSTESQPPSSPASPEAIVADNIEAATEETNSSVSPETTTTAPSGVDNGSPGEGPRSPTETYVQRVLGDKAPAATPQPEVQASVVTVQEGVVTPLPDRESVNLMRDALLPVLEDLIISPISSGIKEGRCKNHSRIFERELGNFKLWAVQMADASSKFPSGVLYGSTYQLGHFDECLGVSVQLPGEQQRLKGQYCLAEVEFSPLEPLPPRTLTSHWEEVDYNTSAWIKVKGEELDRRLRRRDLIYWAMCIPDSCGADELQFSMNEALQKMADVLRVKVEVKVNPVLCQVDTDFFSKLSLADFIFTAVVLVFVLLVSAGTMHDFVRSRHHPARDERHGKFLQCFSAKTTLKNWVRVDPDRDMIPLHAVRFGCMIGILMGHHFIADSSSPLLNTEFLEQVTNNFFALPLLVVPALVVDSFFLVSGFLTARFLLIDLDRNKLKVFSGYMHRYLRLTPVYMLTVALHATLLGKLSSGPLWPTRLARDQYRCSKNWWTNLLYINNYVNTDELCLFQSWHVACDLHFSLIAPILVILLWRRPRSGIALISLLAVATITALYIITWVWDLDPILMSFINVMSDLSADATFRLQYIPTHTRGLPYLFGIVAAYLHYKHPFSKKQLSQAMVLFSWGVTVVLMTSPMVTAVVFYSPHYNSTTWMSALYAAIHRIPWCLGQAWIIVVGITGNAGFLQKVLDFKLLVPLSRLSYCVFLIHNAVQLFMSASVRSPHHLAPPTVVWFLMGDIVVTYTIALIIHVLFEAPIQRLDKTFFTKADNKTKVDPCLPSPTDSNGNGWRQNMAFEKSSDNIATVYQGNLVSTVLNSETTPHSKL